MSNRKHVYDTHHYPSTTIPTVHDAWLASREVPGHTDKFLAPGSQRPLSYANVCIVLSATVQKCVLDLLASLWALNPIRTTLMMTLNIARSFFPALRSYQQALIIDELQSSIVSGNFTWPGMLRLIASELFRRVLEGLFDSFASSNEHIVCEEAKFFIEYQQMANRVRLDVPTLSDPQVRELLQESDLFAQSFNTSGFGLLSPLDFIRIITLVTEIISHLLLIIALTHSPTHVGVLIFSIFTTVFPSLFSWRSFPDRDQGFAYNADEIQAAECHERMRNLVFSDTHRVEISFFGLGQWILQSWSNTRRFTISSEHRATLQEYSIMSYLDLHDFSFALQNVPFALLMQSSSASLGSFTSYRNSLHCAIYACRSLVSTMKMAFQSVYLMVAFCASMQLKPRLQPAKNDEIPYYTLPGGMCIEARGLSYTYPGCEEPALRDINLSLLPGESLAIVGSNGSGKSTLAKVLLRIVDFHQGALFVNHIDVRRYDPGEYHSHLSAVFQGFSKLAASVQENVGVGSIEKLSDILAIQQAVHLAEADVVVNSLPHGLKSLLDTPGFEICSHPRLACSSPSSVFQRHGLSGGEWQRIAIARAFMRANQPEVDLLLLDEPTSNLDAHAQNQIFNTIDIISRSPYGQRLKSVIIITHRLSLARRADKIAMMENGTISEFGSHQELMAQNGSYASLYRASI